jgi:hypothetical protein
MIPVGWLAPTGHWDANTLERLFRNKLYPTGLEFKRHEDYPNTVGCVLVIPGRYWNNNTSDINEAVARFKWVLAIRISDEENCFDHTKIQHPNIRWWIQTPRADVDYGDAYLFGVGHTPHFNELPADPPGKPLNLFISGQNTHVRRHQCFEACANVEPSNVTTLIRPQKAFTDGYSPAEYARHMTHTKVAPAPAGPATPDTFRTYEALQAHCIPIADDITPAYDSEGYWRKVHPDTPMPVIVNYSDLLGYTNDALTAYPRAANRVAAWWMREKRRMGRRLRDDLKALGAL